MENSTRLKIALPWHTYGHDNLGVDALSRANTAIIESAAASRGISVDFLTLGSGQKPRVHLLPPSVEIGPGPSLSQMARGNFDFFRALKNCDIAFDIAEGDSFTDIYGRRRFVLHCITKLASVLMRQPIVLSPQTIGPFDHPLHRRVAKFLMNRLTTVYARDKMSMAFLNDMKISTKKDEFIDVAFRLPFVPARKTGDRVRVGINVSGLLYYGGYSGANELKMSLDYARYIEALIEALLDHRSDVEVNLFCHVAGGGGRDDDAPAVAELGQRYPAVNVIPVFETSSDAKSWISGLDFVVAGRMHACIGAYSAGVPVVPVAYSRKFNGLFGTLNYPYFVDGKSEATDIALARTLAWFEDRQTLIEAIEASRPIVNERLGRYEHEIGELLHRVAMQKG